MAENNELDNKKAINFLKQFRKNGVHNIVSIDPVTDTVVGITREVGHADLDSFIERHNGKTNLYYSVNEPMSNAPDDKLTKKHIKSINAVWLDADPRKDKPFDDERARLKEFAEQLKNDKNPPTYIIDSGGGIQAFWLFDKPLDATPENITMAESLSRGLAEQYGTDYVQNVDRIMRVPFTVNIPSAKKKGRTRTKAKIVHASSPQGTRYEKMDFITPSTKAEAETDFKHTEVDMDAIKLPLPDSLVARLKDTLDRDLKAHDLYYGLIDKPSRSEYDFTLTQQLVWDNYSLQDVAHILYHYPHGKGKDLTKREIIRTYNRIDNPFEGLDAAYVDAIAKQVNPILAARAAGTPLEEDLLKPKKSLGSFITGGEAQANTQGESLFKGLINKKTLSVFYGPSGSGKSFLVLDMAVHLALGRNWAGFKCKGQTSVLYLSLESGASFGKRVVAARERCGVLARAPLTEFPFAFYDKKLNLRTNKDHIAFIEKMIDDLEKQSGHKCGLLVVDTLSAGFAGGDENTKDMTEFVDTLQLLAEKKQVTITIVHHTGKDETAGARGHSSLKANIDTEIRIRSEKKGERYLRSFESDKQKDGKTGGFTKFGLITVEVGKEEDGDVIDTCQIVFENDSEFESVVPNPEEDLDAGELAAKRAAELYDQIENVSKYKLSETQFKALLHRDMKERIGILVKNDGSLDLSELVFMSKPTSGDAVLKAYIRDRKKLSEKENVSGFDF